MTGANHHNGLKTAILMGGLWSLLLLFGWVLAKGTGSSIWLFIMPLIGVGQTARETTGTGCGAPPRSPSPRSVHFRLEIGSLPRRDRFGAPALTRPGSA